MDENSFFAQLQTQYNEQLPFVVYSRPIDSKIKCWVQNDDALYTTTSFLESGFVFSPFDLIHKSILLPQDQCKHYILEVTNLDAKDNETTDHTDQKDKNQHMALVSKGVSTIKKGGLEKVVLSRQVTKSACIDDPLEIFKRLFNTYKNAMVYCWYHPKVGLWLGATPELLFKVEGRQLTTISLAGTQAYNAENEAIWTPKEYEEQQIVTDYITHQIKPFTSLVNVSDVETVRAGNLLHLKSRITSVINSSSALKSIVEALHPTPAVCGFPKQLAKEFILNNETYNREYYTGFLGELNLKQSKSRNTNRRNVENSAYSVVKTQTNFYVNLRCMQLKDQQAIIYVGGGITKDSDAENEWIETVNKTKTIYNVLD